MGVVVLIFSLIALFTVAGGPARMGFYSSSTADRLMIVRPIVERPARKSIIADTDGYSYRTADGTQMTKRDRAKISAPPARTFEYKLPEPSALATELPVVEPDLTLDVVTQPETKTLEDMSVPMMPAEKPEQEPAVMVDPTTNQKYSTAILEADPALSEWVRVTLRCSYREGLLMLYGVVRDEKERLHIADLAKTLPDVQTVENQLHILDVETKTTTQEKQ